jgi:hypothetical protein
MFWARKLTKPDSWLGVSRNTPDDAIPLFVLADLTDKDGELSVWWVADLEGSLRRVAAALQSKDKQPSKTIFRVVDGDCLREVGVGEPRKVDGDSLDDELNKAAHYVFDVTTNGSATKLTRALSTRDQIVFIQSVITDEIVNSVREGRISIMTLKTFGNEMCKYLIKEGKFVPGPSDGSL